MNHSSTRYSPSLWENTENNKQHNNLHRTTERNFSSQRNINSQRNRVMKLTDKQETVCASCTHTVHPHTQSEGNNPEQRGKSNTPRARTLQEY